MLQKIFGKKVDCEHVQMKKSPTKDFKGVTEVIEGGLRHNLQIIPVNTLGKHVENFWSQLISV